MGKASKRKQKKFAASKNSSKSLSESFTPGEIELINQTVEDIKNSVHSYFFMGKETAFFLLDNEGEGYPKKVKRAIQSRLDLMDFPITVNIYLEEKK